MKPVVVQDKNTGLVNVIKWDRPRISRPTRSSGRPCTPHHVRIPNKAYYGFVVVDIWREIYRPSPGATGNEWGPLVERKCACRDFHLFDLQVLLGSCLDHVRNGWPTGWLTEFQYDEGGEYMGESATGTERHMPLMEILCHNYPFIFADDTKKAAAASNSESNAAGRGSSGSASKSFLASMNYHRKSKTAREDEDTTTTTEDGDGAGSQDNNNKKSPSKAGVKTLEIRACNDERRMHSTSTLYMDLETFDSRHPSHSYACNLHVQFIDKSVPFSVAIIALGWDLAQIRTECDRLKAVWGGHATMDTILQGVLFQHPPSVVDPRTALLYISDLGKKGNWPEEKRIIFAQNSLLNDVLPFIGLTPEFNGDKARYLCMCLWMLMMHCLDPRILGHDDRDHYANQRYETNGSQIGSLIRQMMRFFLRHAENTLRNMLQEETEIIWDSGNLFLLL